VSLLVGAFGLLDKAIAGIVSLGGLAENPVSRFFDKIGDSAIKSAKEIMAFSKTAGEDAISNFTLQDMQMEDPEQTARVDEQRRRVREALRNHGVKTPPVKPPPGDTDTNVPLTEAEKRKQEAEAQKRANFLRDLTVRIAEESGSAFQAAIAKIDALEKKAHDTFGKTLPDEVQNGLNKLRIAAVQDENLRKRQEEFGLLRDTPIARASGDSSELRRRINDLTEEQRHVERGTELWRLYQRQIDDVRRSEEKAGSSHGTSPVIAMNDMTKFIEKLKEEQAVLDKNSKQWHDYQKLINEATKQLTKDQLAVADAVQEAAARGAQAWDDAIQRILDSSQDMQAAFTNVAYGISDAFADAFGLIFKEGLTLGKFIAVLGKQIGAALLGGLATYAGGKVAENIAQAFENHARATAAMASGFMNLDPAAFIAAGLYEAAASQDVISAAKWAVLAGAASAASGALSSAGGGSGGGGGGGGRQAPAGASNIGGQEAEDATKNGPQVIIYVDGFNPQNPVHQEKVWEGMTEAEERFGMSVTVLPRRR
jgi:hypothetical protein